MDAAPNADGVPGEWMSCLLLRHLGSSFFDRRKTLGLNLEQKQAVVAEVSEQVKRAQAIVLAEYRGLPVGNMTELRRKARSFGRLPACSEEHPGAPRRRRNAVFGSDRPDGRAARLRHFRRSGCGRQGAARVREGERSTSSSIKGGAMPNVVMSPQEVAALARMPSRAAASGDVDGNDAGADRQARPDSERGSGQVRADAGGGSGTKGEAGRLGGRGTVRPA